MRNLFKENTAVSISLLIINLMLITSIAACIITPIFTSYLVIYPGSEFNYLATSQVLSPEEVQFTKTTLPSSFQLKKGIVSVDLSYVLDNHLLLFIIGNMILMMQLLLTSYGLWVFRKTLMSVQSNTVFDEDNAKRFRNVALIFLFIWASEWLSSFINYQIFDKYFDSVFRISIQLGDLSFGFFTISALIFTLSLVLKKAQDLHEEQKLTV